MTTARKDALKSKTEEELKKILSEDDHAYLEPEDDDDYDSAGHAYWDCLACDAEDELRRREYIKLSKLPGALPEHDAGISHNISVAELKVGSYARYLSRPGTGDYPGEYAECLSVVINDEIVKATWRMTNSEEKSFTSVYELDERINVFEPR